MVKIVNLFPLPPCKSPPGEGDKKCNPPSAPFKGEGGDSLFSNRKGVVVVYLPYSHSIHQRVLLASEEKTDRSLVTLSP